MTWDLLGILAGQALHWPTDWVGACSYFQAQWLRLYDLYDYIKPNKQKLLGQMCNSWRTELLIQTTKCPIRPLKTVNEAFVVTAVDFIKFPRDF